MQNYHYGSRRHVRVQHVDAEGVPVQRAWDVYVNAIELPVPATLAHLDLADLRLITERGPYTEDPALTLLPQLQPVVVASHRRAFTVRSSMRLLSAAAATGRSPAALEPEEITVVLLRRPAVDPGGPTHLNFLPVLPRTDTKSYRDMISIIAHLEHHLGKSFVLVVMGDGQTVLRLRDLKKKFGSLYKHVLIANGNFHSFSHFLFAAHEMFFDAFTCWAARLLGKTRLFVKVLKDLENNNYYHVLELFLPLTSAIYVYLVKHVTHPPAHLFLTHPEAYLRQVGSAGGIVLLQFVLWAGAPTLRWHHTGRAGDGDEVAELHALAIMLHNSVCHKVLLVGPPLLLAPPLLLLVPPPLLLLAPPPPLALSLLAPLLPSSHRCSRHCCCCPVVCLSSCLSVVQGGIRAQEEAELGVGTVHAE